MVPLNYKIREEPEHYVDLQPQVVHEPEPVFVADYKSAIMLDPTKLLEGTFYLSYERILNDRFSLNIAGIAIGILK